MTNSAKKIKFEKNGVYPELFRSCENDNQMAGRAQNDPPHKSTPNESAQERREGQETTTTLTMELQDETNSFLLTLGVLILSSLWIGSLYLNSDAFLRNGNSGDFHRKALRNKILGTTVADLTNKDIRNEGDMRVVVEAVRESLVVETLRISFSRLNVELTGALGEAIGASKKLRTISMFCCSLHHDGMAAFAEGIGQSSTLRRLRLVRNSLRMEGLLALMETLSSVGTTISHLYLWDELIGKEGALCLATALLQWQNLTELRLNSHTVNDECAGAMANILKNHQSLEVLFLYFSGTTGTGFAAVVLAATSMATENPQLMIGGQIGDGGAIEIANALESNRKLTSLTIFDVGNNIVGRAGVVAVAAAIRAIYSRHSKSWFFRSLSWETMVREH